MGRGQPPVNNAPLYIVIADQGGDAFTPGVKIPRPATAPVKYFELIPAAGTIGNLYGTGLPRQYLGGHPRQWPFSFPRFRKCNAEL